MEWKQKTGSCILTKNVDFSGENKWHPMPSKKDDPIVLVGRCDSSLARLQIVLPPGILPLIREADVEAFLFLRLCVVFSRVHSPTSSWRIKSLPAAPLPPLQQRQPAQRCSQGNSFLYAATTKHSPSISKQAPLCRTSTDN